MKLEENIAPGGLPVHIVQWIRQAARKVNGIASGSYRDREGQRTAAPTTDTWTQGDFVENSNKSELGAGGSKYVLQGWDCLVGGTPGTWTERRTLTGN